MLQLEVQSSDSATHNEPRNMGHRFIVRIDQRTHGSFAGYMHRAW
jgi:hypothetical protein